MTYFDDLCDLAVPYLENLQKYGSIRNSYHMDDRNPDLIKMDLIKMSLEIASAIREIAVISCTQFDEGSG